MSSRAAYVAPDRGAQGNALKTLIAMPFALNPDHGGVTPAEGVPRMPQKTAYRFHIGDDVPLDEAEMSLQLATIVLEGLFSPAAVRLDARYHVSGDTRSIVVDASTPVGQSLVRVFTTLLAREFGEGCSAVRRVAAAAAAMPSDDVLVTGAGVAR